MCYTIVMIHDQYANLPMSATLKFYYRNKDKENKRTIMRNKLKYQQDPKYREYMANYKKTYYQKNREVERLKAKIRWAERRRKVLEYVGGETGINCKRCGFDDIRALQIDHVNGGGRIEVRKFRDNKKYLEHITKTPNNYQLLCANCNWIKKVENNEHRYVKKKEFYRKYPKEKE